MNRAFRKVALTGVPDESTIVIEVVHCPSHSFARCHCFEGGLALKAVTASKRMAGTVAARVHLVLIKVLAAAVEVSVEIATVRVLHVVSVVEAVGDLVKAAALEGAAVAAALGIRPKNSGKPSQRANARR